MKKIIKVKEKEINSLDKDLTFKQKAFLKRYFETGNGTKAAMEVYETDNPGSASVIASENLAKLKSPIKTYMETKGFSLQIMLGVLADGLKANRVISAVNTDKQANGSSSDFIEVPDHAVRHKYLETASKWLEVQGTEGTGQQNAIQINNIVNTKKQEYDI